MKTVLALTLFILTYSLNAQNSISATYTNGPIPTTYNNYDASCHGPSSSLSVQLPLGDNYQVTSVHIEYTMTALNGGWKSDQRSFIQFTNILGEAEMQGIGDMEGTMIYSRDMTMANGTYPGGTILNFELWAKRVVYEGISGCNSIINRVDAGTFTITVHFGNELVNPKIGINETNPESTLDVAGKIKIGDDTSPPVAGMIRWNDNSNDFEGFNGVSWVSLTQQGVSGGWGSVPGVNETSHGVSSNTSPGNEFGYSVAINGDYAVIGARSKLVNGNVWQGCAYVFIRNGQVWVEQAILIAPGGSAYDNFGSSVSILGATIVVGAPFFNVGGTMRNGAAFIFTSNGSTWSHQATLTASDGAVEDAFGISVAIDASTIGVYSVVIGANEHDTNGLNASGKAYVYERRSG